MARCPHCDDYETPEPDDGDAGVRAWQEVAHMQLAHPEIVVERLTSDGLIDVSVRFSGEADDG